MRSEKDDEELEAANGSLWSEFLNKVKADVPDARPQSVLDIGCHRGGLLEKLAKAWRPARVYGVEPVGALRKRARFRLRTVADTVEIFDPADWDRVPSSSIDLAVSFETLHLINNLESLFRSVARVLHERGRAYFVLGCHAENPVWPAWREELVAMGHEVTTHTPLAVMQAGSAVGFMPSVRPLRDQGWVVHDPLSPGFSFRSVDQLLAHHFKYKLIFRFVRSVVQNERATR